jgi:nucleoside-diphosphate kinase
MERHLSEAPNYQRTLLIVKPDGIEKGVVGELSRLISYNNLNITECVRKQLDRELAEKIYEEHKAKTIFKPIVDWTISSETLTMVVEGENAVNKVKFGIIGKYPDGLRGKYSDDWIRSVAHSADSIEAAEREIKIAQPLFEERRKNDSERFGNYTVFGLTGMSESGKSTVGKRFESKGVPRLKIKDIFNNVKKECRNEDKTLEEFVGIQEKRDSFNLWDGFLGSLNKELTNRQVNTASMESLYGFDFAKYLKYRMMDSFKITYVDIPEETRVLRQVQRRNLSSIEEARKLIQERDKVKAASGIPKMKEIADIVIDNSGTLEDLYETVDNIILRYKK